MRGVYVLIKHSSYFSDKWYTGLQYALFHVPFQGFTGSQTGVIYQIPSILDIQDAQSE